MNQDIFYVGSYADIDQPSIHAYILDDKNETLIHKYSLTGISNPSYLTSGSNGIYSVQEIEQGAVTYFNNENQKLKLVNTIGTSGSLPCHLLIDSDNQFLYIGNYMGGSIAMLLLNKDGSLNRQCDVKQHVGSGPNELRQEGPHVHFSGFTEDGVGLWCVDLGLDMVKYYLINKEEMKLIAMPENDIHLPKGCGPRHFIFHPIIHGIMYIVCELTSEIITVQLSGSSYKIMQRISTLPENFIESTCSAIKISKNGKFIYASNRGHDSITVLSINENSGRLTLVETVSTHGKTPRDFLLYDEWLIVANQDSHLLAIFKVNKFNGRIKYTENSIHCQSPVCII